MAKIGLFYGSTTGKTGAAEAIQDAFGGEDIVALHEIGKKVVYFGTGDRVGYADNFQDAMGILKEKISGLGAEAVGHWFRDGYEHENSKADRGGKFVRLALDEDNQSELTDEQIQEWTTQLKSEFALQ